MTAFEMATKFKWACLTVNFNFVENYCGHVTVDGQTRIVHGASGSAVWVGPVALTFDTVVFVSETIGSEGAKVNVHRVYQQVSEAA